MILLARHGQTFWNRERRIQGRSESALTPLGERQAAAMASLVADIVRRDAGAPWRLVSSPIGRAVQTATAISRAADLPIELDPRLAEIACGDWEGRLWDDVSAELPDSVPRDERFYLAPGGETFDQVSDRVADWLSGLPDEPDRRVIAVSHGVLGRHLRGVYGTFDRAALLSQDVPQDAIFRLWNGQIDRLDCEPVE